MRFLRAIRRFFAGSDHPVHSFACRRQTTAYRQSEVLVRVYYAALSYLGISLLPSLDAILHPPAVDPLWPVAWLSQVPQAAGIGAIVALYIGGAVAASIFPGSRTARIAAWLGVFHYVAFNNSFGKVGHSMHAWVLTAFIFIFLPRHQGQSSRRAWRQAFLQVFWLAQFVLLLTYSMAGLGKVAGFFYELAQGEMTVLNPHSFAYQIAGRLLQTGSESSFGGWLIEHYWVGWPFYLAMIYIQFFSIWTAFRPVLLRAWAMALLLFHIGSFFIFTILFSPNILLIGLLLLAAPWARPLHFGVALWSELPLVDFFIHRRRRKRRKG